MAKNKHNGHFDRDELIERRAKKRAMRVDNEDHWRFSPKDTYTDEDNEDEIDSWEGHHTA